jgi:hypothetical protein
VYLLHHVGTGEVGGGRPGLETDFHLLQDIDAASLQLGSGAPVQDEPFARLQAFRYRHVTSNASRH